MKRWIPITSLNDLEAIQSNIGYSVIFKHSTQCPVSSMSKKAFEWEVDEIPESVPLYFLDLIRHRDISKAIASLFELKHESPQVILIESGKVKYHASHGAISASKLAEDLKK
jgi:bacillithiol system protein YtxJ